MAGDPDRFDREFFVDRYSRLRSDAARQVERQVLGHEVGLNGFTTVEQARVLLDLLELGPRRRLLDIGAGRGWPGTLLAEASGCHLTSTDIPVNALAETKRVLGEKGLAHRCVVIAANALALPFPPAHFHAISHADVFC